MNTNLQYHLDMVTLRLEPNSEGALKIKERNKQIHQKNDQDL